MLLEVIKIVIMLCDMNQGGDVSANCCYDTCCGCNCSQCGKRHHQLSDSWVIVIFLLFGSPRFDEMKSENDRGELPLFSWLKCIQWIFRDLVMVIIVGLYARHLDKYYIWFILLTVAVACHWIGMRIRLQIKLRLQKDAKMAVQLQEVSEQPEEQPEEQPNNVTLKSLFAVAAQNQSSLTKERRYVTLYNVKSNEGEETFVDS